jgi:hypothetical protein
MLKFEDMGDTAKHVLDALSVVTVVGTLMQMLPSIAALFTIVWTGIRIYETNTIQKLLGKEKDNGDT